MIHQELLRRAIDERDRVLAEFVEVLAPGILEFFAAIPALGGSGKIPALPGLTVPAGLATLSEMDYANFRKLADQSMATHLLNGIFAAMRLAQKLPPAKALSDPDKKLWLLGYICHDYTKIYGIKIAPGNIPLIYDLIERLGALLNFEAFQQGWKDYLGDIAFLAQNTQTKEGSNLDISQFKVRTDRRALDTMRLLSSIADILVHIKSPSEVVISPPEHQTAENLREKIITLFGAGRAPRLTYHKLTEVRGLLSNLINNAAMETLERQGWEPFLFFPNGVVYLTAPGIVQAPDINALTQSIWIKIAQILLSDEKIGLKRAGTGMKVSPVIYELVDYQTLMRIGQQAALAIRNSKASERFSADQISKGNLILDLRTDQLAEFIIFLKRRVVEALFPSIQGFPEMLLSALGLSDEISVAETENQSGGVLLGWWYVAARYLSLHRTMDDYELGELMGSLQEKTITFIESRQLLPKVKSTLADSFSAYLQSILVMDSYLNGLDLAPLQKELTQYIDRKARNKPTCSLCSTPFESIQQPETTVLFKPQQYTNKLPLGSSKMPPRGICPICIIEMMLRMVQQGAPGKVFQDQKPIYFWLYPTYFFTTETAQVVRRYIGQMIDLNFFDLRKHLQAKGFSLSALLNYPGFVTQSHTDHSYGIVNQTYDQHDMASLFCFAVRPFGKDTSDTDSWVIPAFYALALPLLLDVKVVATTSFVPLFASGADFVETSVLDAPHQFTRYILGKDRFRVDELPEAVMRLLRLYDLHMDVIAERTDLHWPQVNALVKDIVTDPYYVFYYYDHKKRKEDNAYGNSTSPELIQRYLETYQTLGGQKNMGLIGELVDAYSAFYRAKGKLDSAYSLLKPFTEAADAVIESGPETGKEDLILLVAGAVNDLMERVRSGQADGWDPIVRVKSEIPYPERLAISRQKQMEFARLFVEKLFNTYCAGDRGLLRERLNRLRSAARFYYLSKYGYGPKEEEND